MQNRMLSALIVDPNSDRRQQLRYMLKTTGSYDVINVVVDHDDLLAKLNEEVSYDVLYITTEQSQDYLESLLEGVKKSEEGKVFLSILVLHTVGDFTYSPEQAILMGAHGCLLEPFSVDDIQTQTSFAIEELNRIMVEQRQKAVQSLTKSMMQATDVISTLQREELGVGAHMKQVREMASSLKGLDKETLPFYFQQLFEVFEDSPVVPEVPEGLSAQEAEEVKKRIEKRKAKGCEISVLERNGVRMLVCYGNLGLPDSLEKLQSTIDQEFENNSNAIIIDCTEATNLNMKVATVFLKTFKDLQSKGGKFRVLEDGGLLKRTIKKLKEMKLEQGEGASEGSDDFVRRSGAFPG